MFKNRIIPCLDVKDGRVVKGINFVELKDAGDPVEQAKIYSEDGADEICFLDITASNENRETIIDIVKKTETECFVPLTVGGGARKVKNITDLLLAGADKVSINTAAVKNVDFVKDAANKFGSQCIVVAIDAKKVSENTTKKSLVSILGGGDTISAINKSKYKFSFTHLSTAGGAFLEFLEGKDLPGLNVLK